MRFGASLVLACRELGCSDADSELVSQFFAGYRLALNDPEIENAAPDYVALLQRGHAEFGVGPFGEDPQNGRGIVSWVHDEYDLIERFGPPPFQARGFGAELWKRKSDAPAPQIAR